jgi:hypothetical protein
MLSRQVEQAKQVFAKMQDRGVTPNAATYSVLISFLDRAGDMAGALALRQDMAQLTMISAEHNDLGFKELKTDEVLRAPVVK